MGVVLKEQFHTKLWSIVLNTTTYQRMIDWTTDGTHLVIYDLAALLECIGTDVLKKEKAATFGAFTRQMRNYRWNRIKMRQQVALFKGMPCEAIIWKHEYLRRGSTMDDVRACRSKEKAKLQKTSASKARVVEAGRKEIGKTGDVASANEFPETSAAPKRDQEMIDTSLMATFASDDPFNQGPRSEICGQEGGSDLEAPGAVSHSPEAFPGYLATGPLTPGNSEASFSFPFLSVPSMEPPHIPSTHELATSLAVQNARQLSCRVHWPFEAAACDQCHSARMFDHADVLAVMPDSIRFAI